MDEDAPKLQVDLWPLASKLTMLEIAFATLIGRLALSTGNSNREIEAFLVEVKTNMDGIASNHASSPGRDRWDSLMQENFTNLQQVLRFQFPGEKSAGDLN